MVHHVNNVNDYFHLFCKLLCVLKARIGTRKRPNSLKCLFHNIKKPFLEYCILSNINIISNIKVKPD